MKLLITGECPTQGSLDLNINLEQASKISCCLVIGANGSGGFARRSLSLKNIWVDV